MSELNFLMTVRWKIIFGATRTLPPLNECR